MEISKADCVTIDKAAELVDVSKATLYNYMNILNVQRRKFPADRRAYVSLADVERVKELKAQAQG